MTEQEAIDYYNNVVIDTKMGVENICKTSVLINLSIKALEKQIPKEVIRKNIREYYRFYCPNNHFIFEEHCKIFDLNKHDFSKSGYCECCGQKLDWSKWE